MKSMQPMALGDFSSAPLVVKQTVSLPASPEAVFAELAPPERWLEWFPLMRRAAWTSATHNAIGAERRVHLSIFGGFEERFIAWEPGVRYAFTMIASDSPLVDRMAEDWQLARDGGGTQLTWIVGGHPTRLGRIATPALRFTLNRLFARGTAKLGRLLEQHGKQVA
jgi:uncharacterized protein YndB with AHSA1/START domain